MSKRLNRKDKSSKKQMLAKQDSVLEKPTNKITLTLQDTPSFWKRNWWQSLILFLLPFALYWQCIDYGYVLDDLIVIEENSFTQQGFAGIDDLLTTESFTGYFGEQKNLVQGNRYRPLSLITFAIEYEIFGGQNPAVSHFINILLYGLIGLLLFRLMSLLLGKYADSRWWLSLPFVIAGLYILHPIHSEAVANIKGRDEIMAMILSLSTLYYCMRYSMSRKIWQLILSMVVFFLALLSKENSITFLAVIPLTFYFFNKSSISGSLKKVLPYLAVTAVYLAIRFSAAGVPNFGEQSRDLMNNAFLGMSGMEKMATIFFTLLKYVQLYIFPHPLNHDYYPYEIPILNWGDWRPLAGLALYLGLLVWAIFGLKKRSVVAYGLLFYFATLTIVSNIVVNLGTFMNERFIFMASLGLTITTAYLITEKLGKWKLPMGQYLATALLAVLVIGYSYKTLDRVPDWETALSLNQSAVDGGSNSARANSFMATALYQEAKQMTPSPEQNEMLQEAYGYATKAIKIHPTYLNANLMLSGIAAELYKKHRDQTRLLADFRLVADRRPDVPYLTEYLDYLEGNTRDMDELKRWYTDVGLSILESRNINPKWCVHYLLRAYKFDRQNSKILKGLSQGYTLLRDDVNAQRFTNELNRVQ